MYKRQVSDLSDTVVTAELTTDEVQSVEPGQTVTMNMYTMDGSELPLTGVDVYKRQTEDLTPIQKQDLEGRFWNLCNGGKIQYVKYPIDYNHCLLYTSRCV